MWFFNKKSKSSESSPSLRDSESGSKGQEKVNGRQVAEAAGVSTVEKQEKRLAGDKMEIESISESLKNDESSQSAEVIPRTGDNSPGEKSDKAESPIKEGAQDLNPESLKETEKENNLKKNEDEVKKLKESKSNNFFKYVKGEFKDVVKNVQKDEGAIQQDNNYIHGDAAFNAFFYQKINETDSNSYDELMKLDILAEKSFSKKFAKVVMPNGGLSKDKISEFKDSSLKDARLSQKRVEETAGDQTIVEMYYNQLEKLQKENTESKFLGLGSKDKKGSEKEKDEAADIFKYGKDRAFDVEKRKEEQIKLREKLENEGRISSTIQRVGQSVKYSIYNAVINTLSVGIASVKENRDKRGWTGKEDFKLDLETGEAEKIDLKNTAGHFEVKSFLGKGRDAIAEFKQKRASRQDIEGGGYFSTLSLGLEVAKKFLGIAKGMCSAAAIWLVGLSLIPGLQPLAVIAAWASTFVYWLGFIMSGISTLRTLLDGVVQALNSNPSLFTELSSETKKSALTTGIEMGSFAAESVGSSMLRQQITGKEYFSEKALYDPTATLDRNIGLINATEGLSSAQKTDSLATQFGATGVTSVILPTSGAIVTSKSAGLTNLDMKFNPDLGKEEKIGKDTKKTAQADDREQELIAKSFKTTLEKARGAGKKIVPVFEKLSGDPPGSSGADQEKIKDDDKDKIGGVRQIGGEVSNFAGMLREDLQGLIVEKKK
jgi:hypothetical protein